MPLPSTFQKSDYPETRDVQGPTWEVTGFGARPESYGEAQEAEIAAMTLNENLESANAELRRLRDAMHAAQPLGEDAEAEWLASIQRCEKRLLEIRLEATGYEFSRYQKLVGAGTVTAEGNTWNLADRDICLSAPRHVIDQVLGLVGRRYGDYLGEDEKKS